MKPKPLNLEELAEIEHKQWIEWSKFIAEELKEIEGHLVYERTKDALKQLNDIQKRWAKSWKPYSELTEETKESDRKYAKKVLQRIKSAVQGLLEEIYLTDLEWIVYSDGSQRRMPETERKKILEILIKKWFSDVLDGGDKE